MSDKKDMINRSLVERYHKAGKSAEFIHQRTGLPLNYVKSLLSGSPIHQQTLEDQEKDEIGDEGIFEECPPTTKDELEYQIVLASSNLAQAASSLLSINAALMSALVDESVFLEYLVQKHQECTSDNVYEFLTDSILSDFIVIPKKK